jgi:hypothetical protein
MQDDNAKTAGITAGISKEEVMAAIKELAERLGYAPTLPELIEKTQIRRCEVRRHFETYRAALEACGLERKGSGYGLKVADIFKNWATVVRKLGKIPSVAEYQLHGTQCPAPAMRRFGVWAHVPAGMLRYARESGLEKNGKTCWN